MKLNISTEKMFPLYGIIDNIKLCNRIYIKRNHRFSFDLHNIFDL